MIERKAYPLFWPEGWKRTASRKFGHFKTARQWISVHDATRRVLNEFRDAVDYIRTVSLAVQQLRERQFHGSDDSEAAAVLVADRVRRTANLCLEVITDIDGGKMSLETKGVDELYHSLEQVCDRLRHLLKSREPGRYVTNRT